MIDAEKLISILWKPYISEVAQGYPVYFCFYKEQLDTIFAEEKIPTSNPIELICDIANQYLVIDGDDIHLAENALKRLSCGFSPAILLVCQQVIAVEDMVRQTGGHTEHAYFPRLRQLISPKLGEFSKNPFCNFDEFESIWRKLAEEIRSIKGHTSHSITFRFGLERGINKARTFPLSQALFTGQDLHTLVKKIGAEKIKKTSKDTLWFLIKDQRYHLSRRAAHLISHNIQFLKEGIIDQVKTFAGRLQTDTIILNAIDKTEETKYDLILYKEQVDFFNDEFRAYLFDPTNNIKLFDDEQINNQIKSSLIKDGYLILPMKDSKDCWTKSLKTYSIYPGESFLIIGTKSGTDFAFDLIQKYINKSSIDINHRDYDFAHALKIIECLLPDGISNEVYVSNGKLISANSQVRKYKWINGTCVDARTNRYLYSSLPTHVQFQNELIPITSLLKVNDRFIDWSSFFNGLDKDLMSEEFEFTFSGLKKAKLSIATYRTNSHERLGYVVKGVPPKITPTPDWLSPQPQVMFGFQGEIRIDANSLSLADALFIMRSVRENGLNIQSLKDAIKLYHDIDSSEVPAQAKSLMHSVIKSHFKINSYSLT